MRYNFRPDITTQQGAEECLKNQPTGTYCTWKASPFALGLSYVSLNDQKPVHVPLVNRKGYVCSYNNMQDVHVGVKEFLRSRQYLNSECVLPGTTEEADVIRAVEHEAKELRSNERSYSTGSNSQTEAAAYENADGSVWGGTPSTVDVDELLAEREEANIVPTSPFRSAIALVLSLVLSALVVVSVPMLIQKSLEIRKRESEFTDLSTDIQSQVVDSLRSHQYTGGDCETEMYQWIEGVISHVHSFQELADSIGLADLATQLALCFTGIWILIPAMLLVGCPSAKEPTGEGRRRLHKVSRVLWMVVFWISLFSGVTVGYYLFKILWRPSLAIQAFLDVVGRNVMDRVETSDVCHEEMYKYAQTLFEKPAFISLDCIYTNWIIFLRHMSAFEGWFLVPEDTYLFAQHQKYIGPSCTVVPLPDTLMSTALVGLFGMLGCTLGTFFVVRVLTDLSSGCKLMYAKIKPAASSQQKEKVL
eukprot:gb/GECG01006892.1/.p1 GENE.gb/GECG01006892.1/~~gb/GECG01006892.1/.p1  ORF type:complete len:475 (+),score=42.62 gb/GECG01006892.1/:1-1425(+)